MAVCLCLRLTSETTFHILDTLFHFNKAGKTRFRHATDVGILRAISKVFGQLIDPAPQLV